MTFESSFLSKHKLTFAFLDGITTEIQFFKNLSSQSHIQFPLIK